MLEEAVEICRKGVRKHPGYPSGRVVEGKCHFDLGEVDDAERSFQAVLELDENNLVALKYLGMILAGRGQLEDARDRFKHILALDPDNREIRGMLEDLSLPEGGAAQRDRHATGSEFEGEPISLGSDDTETSDELATTTLADIYAAQGYKDKAIKIYREVLKDQPGNEDIKRKLAELVGDEEFSGIEEPQRVESLALGDDGTAWSEDDRDFDVEDDDGDDKALSLETVESVLEDEPPGEKKLELPDGKRRGQTVADDVTEEAEEDQTPAVQSASSRSIDDKKSYEQFQRWLKNLQD
jgi:tetratricopeptide (TPR) repeat protein